MNLKNTMLMGLAMTLVLYIYTAFLQPVIASYADPTMTYGFPLVMGFVVAFVYDFVYKFLNKAV